VRNKRSSLSVASFAEKESFLILTPVGISSAPNLGQTFSHFHIQLEFFVTKNEKKKIETTCGGINFVTIFSRRLGYKSKTKFSVTYIIE
jgi:hypothetical protein